MKMQLQRIVFRFLFHIKLNKFSLRFNNQAIKIHEIKIKKCNEKKYTFLQTHSLLQMFLQSNRIYNNATSLTDD